MGILKYCLKIYDTEEKAQEYLEKIKDRWNGNVGIIEDKETESFDVYIYEYPELMDADLSVREDIFFQSLYCSFPEEFNSY